MMKGVLLSERAWEQRLRTRKIVEEAQEAIDWLSTYAPEYGISDEVVDEIRIRLEHIAAMARTIITH